MTELLAPAPPTPSAIVFAHDSGRAPAASVAIPAWRAAPFLGECLDSVLAQDLADFELILVDDASDDETGWLALDWLRTHASRFGRVLLLRHAVQAGPAAARDTALRNARSPAALLLDADNRLFPRCLSRLLAGLEASGAAFVYPILQRIGLDSGLQGFLPFDAERLKRKNYIDTLSLVRVSAWQAVGGFPSLHEGHEDHAFWLALLEKGLGGALVPEILAAYRVHLDSRTARSAIPRRAEIDARLSARFPWLGEGETG